MKLPSGLARKILLPNLVFLALLLFVLGSIFVSGSHVRNELLKTTESIQRQNKLLAQMNNLRRERQKAVLQYRFERNPSQLVALNSSDGITSVLLDDLKKSVRTDREKRLVNKILLARDESMKSRDALLKAVREGNDSQIELAYTRWSMLLGHFDALFSDLTVLTAKALDKNIAHTDAVRAKTLLVVGAVTLLALILHLVFAIATRQRLVKPIVNLTETARGVAAGDLSLRVKITDRSDEIGVLAGAFNEMTERLAAARHQLERSVRELSRSNSDLEQFAYVSSHDLKEPLRMITLYAQLLEKESKDALSSKSQGYVDNIVESAKRMQGLINDLLMYSRVSGVKEEMELVDLGWALETAKQDLKATIGDSRASISSGPLPTVIGSPILLVQLFENLLSNAIKFRGESPPDIRIDCLKRDDKWVVGVHDNGIGIKPEYRDKIFVIFQRLHSRAQYPGTGIGLAICKKIAERGGGKIWVEENADRGSTFRVSFPRVEGTA